MVLAEPHGTCASIAKKAAELRLVTARVPQKQSRQETWSVG